ncbi:MAG: DUF3575 domain-containing protein [Chitinophagales bacterium]
MPHDSLINIHKNIFSTYLLFDAGCAFKLGYEHAFSKKISLYQWMVYYPLSYDPPWTIKSNTLIGMSEGRFFPFKKAPKGFFGGHFLFDSCTWYQSGYSIGESFTPSGYTSADSVHLSFGIVTGYKFIIKKRIVAELRISAGRNFLWGDESPGFGYDDKFMVFPMINIGYAFR